MYLRKIAFPASRPRHGSEFDKSWTLTRTHQAARIIINLMLGVLFTAGIGLAQFTGTVWESTPDAADASDPANMGSTLPRAQFAVGNTGIFFCSDMAEAGCPATTGYTVSTFLGNPGFTAQVNGFNPTQALDNTEIQLVGSIYLFAGGNNFNIGHDDGFTMQISGGPGTATCTTQSGSLCVNVPGETTFVVTPFTINATVAGIYNFTLNYAECCGAPAYLLFSYQNNAPVGSAEISKSFGAASIPLGGTTSLSFTVVNPNASGTLTSVAFDDGLPLGLVVATPNGLTGSCDGGTITATAGSSGVILGGATLAPGASCTFSVNVTGTMSGVQNNAVTVSSSAGTGNTATATVTVVPASPPSITKFFGATSIAVGGSTSLTFNIVNPNASAILTGVAFTDFLPAGLIVASPNGLTGSCGGGTITATAGSASVILAGATLAAGANCTFSVNVTGTAAGVQNNSVTVVANVGTGNTGTASVTVTPASPPSISKLFGATSIAVGGSTSLTFNIVNPNASAILTGVAFTDFLPAGLIVASPNGLSGSCGGGTITATAGSSEVILTGATLAAGATCTFSVNVTGTAAGIQNNSVTVVANVGTGNTGTATITVAPGPPSITKLFGATSITVGGSTSLTFSIVNPNASAILAGVAFTDNLPAGLIVASPNGLTGSCGGGTITAIAGSASVGLAGATLAGGASCTFSVNVTGTAVGPQNNSVTVTSSIGTGNTSTATVTVLPAPPSITKLFGATSIAVSGSTSLTFSIVNPNPSASLTGVAFTDNLPAGLIVASPNGLTGSCGGGTITAIAGSASVSLAGATLAGGASCTFSVNVSGTTVGPQNNSVTVTSTNGGTGNTSVASVTVVPAAPPSITKLFGAASITLGGSTSLTFNIVNPNASTILTGVAFTDNLPAGLVVASPNGLTGSCGGGTITATAGSASVILAGATLAGGASCTFSVNVTGTAVGPQNNSVTVTSSIGTGNTGTATVTVVPAPPSITKLFGATSINIGGSTSLTFSIVNPNASAILTGVAFTDNLPAGLIVASPNGLTGSCGGGTITATAGSASVILAGATLAGGATCTFSVNVTGTAAGPQNNSVTVTSTNGGTGNTSTATITVTPPAGFLIRYAANLNIGESYIDIANTGANGAPLLGPGFGAAVGNICANVYAFDPGEELVACCSCLITPDQTVNLGVNRDLTVKTLTGVIPTSVTVKLLSSLAGGDGTGTSCTNSAATVATTANLGGGAIAWGTTLHLDPAGAYDSTETPFTLATLSPGELASLGGRCASILGNGSGFGVCNSCQAGALGGASIPH